MQQTAAAIHTGAKAQRTQQFTSEDGWLTRTQWLSRAVYWGIHASCLLVFATGAPLEAVLLGVATYVVRVLGITAGYHRYFAHKSYKTGRAFQFVLALVGCSATQKGPLWWCGTHRRHHRYTDAPGDPHSPKEGFFYAHIGWIFDSRWEGTPTEGIRDFAKYPELRWLNAYHWVPPLTLALLCTGIGALSGAGALAGVVWGFSVSTVVLWHATFLVNSGGHVWGRRRYNTEDTSRNNWWIALLTMGEGWHNNHHHYMASARNGFFWWELDVTYYLLKVLSWLGIVWDIKTPGADVLAGGARAVGKGAPMPEAA